MVQTLRFVSIYLVHLLIQLFRYMHVCEPTVFNYYIAWSICGWII